MAGKRSVAEVHSLIAKHEVAEKIAHMWADAKSRRREWEDQKLETRNFLFATSTRTTSGGALPWKNSTTMPKLAQIRDNLHANYMGALFPNDDYVQWEPGNADAAREEKARVAKHYVLEKARQSELQTVISQLLYDYIDTGVVFADVVHVREQHELPDGTLATSYVGPRLIRYGYQDIVFDPRAMSFEHAWKITRAVISIAELAARADAETENRDAYMEVLNKADSIRSGSMGLAPEDINLVTAYAVDGFGSMQDYLESGYVEILTFYGSIYDASTKKLHKNRKIVVVDRSWIAENVPMPSWLGKSTFRFTVWRDRPDNLYGMGPLDNLVGMQYRLDHLENSKADAYDMAIIPPLAIKGSVEEFVWEPGAEILLGDDGQVTELGKNLGPIIAAQGEMDRLEMRMEEYAGAPKQAMGVRTPGEKTAFEVQTLDQASSRIFQHKVRRFELDILEPVLNLYLEIGRRNLSEKDTAPVRDFETGAITFLDITREDLESSGSLRAVGARHYATEATLVQNLMAIVNSGLWSDPSVRAHWSGKRIAALVEQLLRLDRYNMFQSNVAVTEGAETAQLQAQAQEEVEMANMTPPEPPDAP